MDKDWMKRAREKCPSSWSDAQVERWTLARIEADKINSCKVLPMYEWQLPQAHELPIPRSLREAGLVL